jgi:hypothetical protein
MLDQRVGFWPGFLKTIECTGPRPNGSRCEQSRSRFVERDPGPESVHFAVLEELIRDKAGQLYRDGKSHTWIGAGHPN